MHTTTEKEYLEMQNLSKSCGKFNSIQSYKLTQELTASNTHALTHRITHTHTHTSIYICMHTHSNTKDGYRISKCFPGSEGIIRFYIFSFKI